MRFGILHLLFIVVFLPAVHVAAQNSKLPCADMAEDILHYVNVHRAKMGLQPMKMNEVISRAAQVHSLDMARGAVPFGHDGFEQRVDRISQQVRPANAWAENVADGALSAREVVDLWLHSPGHRKNIEGDYNLTGIGIAKDSDGELYFTQIFVKQGR